MSRKLVLITGASSDIGLELVKRLVAIAEPPIVLAHCHSSAERIEALGLDGVHTLTADLSAEGGAASLAKAVAAHGTPDQIIHLPGIKLVYERFSKFKWAHFETDFRVQVQSAVILLKHFLPAMAKTPGSRVVFLLSSVTRGVPPKFMSMYTMVKYTQLGLMRALASEYAETGPCVNAVSPGMVDTRFLENLPDFVKEAAAAASPKRRNTTTAEVVDAIEFLLSPQSASLTGVEIPVTGGAVF